MSNEIGSPNMATAQVVVGTTATLLVAARDTRKNAILYVHETTGSIYIGNSSSVTSSTGYQWDNIYLSGNNNALDLSYRGDIYAISPGGAQTVSVIELYE